jgi:hypothetical protein
MEPGKGGASDNKGNCAVPDDETAQGRTIRMHEALHVDFTPTRFKPKDLLDQALEDARLHRHCAKTVTPFGDGARRDEKSVAIRDLRKVLKTTTIAPIDSLVALRAMAILKGEHPALVSKACSRIGKRFESEANTTIDALGKCKPGSKAWQDVRKPLAKYFREDFKPNPQSGDSGIKDDKQQNKPGAKAEKQDDSSAKGEGESEPEDESGRRVGRVQA